MEVAAWAELGVKPASALGAALAGRGADRFIGVDTSLRGLLPDGLARGSTVVVAGQGAGRTSLLLSLLAEATRAGSWSAIVGMPAVSLAAAGWLGVDLGRAEAGGFADSRPSLFRNPHQINGFAPFPVRVHVLPDEDSGHDAAVARGGDG